MKLPSCLNAFHFLSLIVQELVSGMYGIPSKVGPTDFLFYFFQGRTSKKIFFSKMEKRLGLGANTYKIANCDAF